MAACLKDLLDIRQKRNKVCHLWQSDVLYIREVQKRLKRVADKLATDVQKKELVELLKGILHPWDVLQEKYFPDIREILASMLDEVTRKEPFEIRNIKTITSSTEKSNKVSGGGRRKNRQRHYKHTRTVRSDNGRTF